VKKLPLSNSSYKYLESSFKEWLDIIGYSHQTIYYLPLHIREFMYWLEQKGINNINQLTHSLITEYYEQLKERGNQMKAGALSNSYLNKHLQALKKFTDYLRQVGRLEIPQLEMRWEEDETKNITVITVEEIKQMFQTTYDREAYCSTRLSDRKMEALQSRDRAMITVFYGCGLRRNEAVHLDIGDINFDKRLLHVRMGKGYKERYVPFSKPDSKHLQEYIYDYRPVLLEGSGKLERSGNPGRSAGEGAFFISYMIRRMGGQSLLLRLKQLQYRTGNTELIDKEIGLHTLRHSIATHLLQAGMSLENISRFLGHSSLESTQIYTHLAGVEPERTQPFNNIPKREITQLEEE